MIEKINIISTYHRFQQLPFTDQVRLRAECHEVVLA